MGMTLKNDIYVDKMPHPNNYHPKAMGGWQETEE
jgi:hypothetical protein